jgi:DNA end-binding protein Ku
MAPRAYWKGFLRLSLVSCPIALFPATSEREKIRFHQINRETGHRIRYAKVDALSEQRKKSPNGFAA